MKKIITLATVLVAAMAMNAQVIKNDFLTGYEIGKNLEIGTYANTTQGDGTPIMINQWNLSGKAPSADDVTAGKNNDQGGASPLTVAPLTYTGYAESGKDVAIDLLKLESNQGRTTIYSLAKDYTYGAGTYYVAFMTKVSTAGSANEYFSFDGNYTANGQRVRYTIKGIDEDTYEVGLGNDKAATTFASTPLNYNQTYLAVIKITLNANATKPTEGDGTGSASLYINPTLASEPAAATATVNFTGSALKSIRGLTIRQRSNLAAQIGGFRFASSWAAAIGDSGTNLAPSAQNDAPITLLGNTLLTAPGFVKVIDLAGAEVLSQATDGSLDLNLNKGIYIASFTGATGETAAIKVAIK